VTFAGRTLDGVPLEDIVKQGIALVPEGRHIFATLTVLENLRLGATTRTDADGVAADIEGLLQTFPILGERRRQPAGQLSGGEQQQLAIARALLCRPKLLMLDEPSLGLAPAIVDQVYALLATIRARGVSILLVEQNAERAFGFADFVHVMSQGEFALGGSPADLRDNQRFDAAYFGIRMQERAAP
jgi:branched-chain amino acid transport system ATP-binding protein